MPPLFILLLWALPSAAAEYFRDPDFWSKTYSIPSSYCTHAIAVESREAPRLPPGCAFDAPDETGHRYARCPLPSDDVVELRESLDRAGRVVGYSQDCRDVPQHGELYYKRERLEAESAELARSSVTLPAIRGLLEAQLSALSTLIALHEAATPTVVQVLLAPPGSDPRRRHGAIARHAHRARPPERRREPRHPWSRVNHTACQQAAYVAVRVMPAAPVERMLSRLGEPYDDPTCRLREHVGAERLLLSRSSPAELQRAATSLAGLVGWERVDPQRAATDVPDDRREELLSRELSRNGPLLERFPHIESLARAEIERVREPARRLRALRAGTLIVVHRDHPDADD